MFNIDGGELHYIAKYVYKLDFNELSPFKRQQEGGAKPSESSVRLAEDADLKKTAGILAEPDLKIAFRREGPASPYEAFAGYVKKKDDTAFLVNVENSGGIISTAAPKLFLKRCFAQAAA